jgi:hypothetical protein
VTKYVDHSLASDADGLPASLKIVYSGIPLIPLLIIRHLKKIVSRQKFRHP